MLRGSHRLPKMRDVHANRVQFFVELLHGTTTTTITSPIGCDDCVGLALQRVEVAAQRPKRLVQRHAFSQLGKPSHPATLGCLRLLLAERRSKLLQPVVDQALGSQLCGNVTDALLKPV